MGHNFNETAVNNIDKKKFDESHKRIFGNRENVDCKKCDLSSRQKKGEAFTCPHCEAENE